MKKPETKYYIDYVIKNVYSEHGCYYTLVRTKDDAVLESSIALNNIFLACFHRGISKDEVSIL